MHFELEPLIRSAGYIGIFTIIFAESGLLIGFFLPGDSLLFTAGILASQGLFDITILTTGVFIAAILGDNVGYAFGKRVGPRLFKRPDSLLFHQKNIERAQAFFEKHGGKTLILARFTPVVRTFAPILAGVGKMEYKRFFFYNVIGAVIWAIGVTLLGYFLGQVIPDIEKYVVPVAILIIIASIVPSVWHLWQARNSKPKSTPSDTEIKEDIAELKRAIKKD